MDYRGITKAIHRLTSWTRNVTKYEITSAVFSFYRMLNDVDEIPNENLIKVICNRGGDYFLRELVDKYREQGPSQHFNKLFDFIVEAGGITLSKEGVEAVDACLPPIDEIIEIAGEEIELDQSHVEHLKRILYSECATYMRETDHDIIKHRVNELIEKL